eukprot:1209307-Rhodomonas_salina.1
MSRRSGLFPGSISYSTRVYRVPVPGKDCAHLVSCPSPISEITPPPLHCCRSKNDIYFVPSRLISEYPPP